MVSLEKQGTNHRIFDFQSILQNHKLGIFPLFFKIIFYFFLIDFYFSLRISPRLDNNVMAEDQTRKREIRLQKNREAARECRRKKKEYIKCLENRVAVLENQNKALIEELKSLKELYCQTKTD